MSIVTQYYRPCMYISFCESPYLVILFIGIDVLIQNKFYVELP